MTSGSDSTVDTQTIYRHSAALRFLYGTLGARLSVPGACLLWMLLQAILFLGLGLLDNNLAGAENNAEGIGLVQDSIQLANIFGLPLLFIVLYYALRAYSRYLTRLHEVLDDSSASSQRYAALLHMATDWFGHNSRGKKLFRILYCVGIVLVLFNALTNLFPGFFYARPEKWDGRAFPISYAVNRAYILFVWGYMLPTWGGTILSMFIGMVQVNRVLAKSDDLIITPVPKDPTAGLGILSSAALWMGYAALPAGIYVIAPLLRGASLHFGNYLLFVVSGPIAGLLSFYPMSVLHSAMKRRKQALLEPIATMLDELTMKLHELLTTKQDSDVEVIAVARSFDATRRLYQQIQEMPTWPLDTVVVSKLVFTIVAPLGLFLLEKGISGLSGP